MKKNLGLAPSAAEGFTLVELLIVMAVLAILILVPTFLFKSMQDEARKSKVQGDLRTLQIAVESYYKNNRNLYPTATTAGTSDWQNPLASAIPHIIEAKLYDPFGLTQTTEYIFKTDNDNISDVKYYIIYSVGILGSGSASVNTQGMVTTSNEALWVSNGHE